MGVIQTSLPSLITDNKSCPCWTLESPYSQIFLIFKQIRIGGRYLSRSMKVYIVKIDLYYLIKNNYAIIGSDNGLSPVRCQVIT